MSNTRFALVSVLIAAICFAAVAPTLTWLEFSSGSENLVTEAVLEMRRGGPWLIPTLAGAPRTSKPPLPAWICATFVRPQSVAALADRGAAREAAYRRLAWEVRWPALVFACLTLIAGAWLGRALLADNAGGIATAIMMASSVIWLRFGRSMTTDVQLALWVTIANAFFVVGILKKRPWLAATCGGAALGLALMSKGPVALAQTTLPLLAFVAWRRWGMKKPIAVHWPAVIVAAVVALGIALPWPIVAATHLPGQARMWFREVALGGAKNDAYDPPWMYLAFLPLLLPWAGLFVLGLVGLWREKSDRAVLAIALTLVPIVVMCCFTEKNDRYLLPMVAPGAVIAAAGFITVGNHRELNPLRGVVMVFTWGFLVILALGLPLAGGLFLRNTAGTTWWPIAHGASAAAVLLAIVAIAWRLDSSGRRTLLPAGAIVMLLTNAMMIHGYARSERGRSDGKPISDAIVAAMPADTPVWIYAEPGRFSRSPVDTVIYLDRIVVPVTDLSTLASDRPVAVMVHCRAGQTLPAALTNWRVIGTMPKNQGLWHICVPPAPPAPPAPPTSGL